MENFDDSSLFNFVDRCDINSILPDLKDIEFDLDFTTNVPQEPELFDQILTDDLHREVTMEIDEDLKSFLTDDFQQSETIILNFNDSSIMMTVPILEKIDPTVEKFPQNFTCVLCKVGFPSRFNLERHFNSVKHLKAENEFLVDSEDVDEKIIIEDLIVSKDFEEPLPIDAVKCKDCSKSFKNAYQLKKHQQSLHRVFKCEKCSRGFKTEKEFSLHIARHQKSDTFQCEHCGKAFTNNTNLRRHEKQHLVDLARKFECKVCSKVFHQKSNLTRHMKVHEKKK